MFGNTQAPQDVNEEIPTQRASQALQKILKASSRKHNALKKSAQDAIG
jgi:hypothetical protein